MKVAVIIEGSTKHRSADVEQAVRTFGHEVYNLGMRNVEGEPDLTYMETGLLTALLLNLGAVEFVVGGCGTGQGYMNAVLQYPGTACGLLYDPVEAFLFSQVNAGNCISLPLNKGYGGVGGDLNVLYILEKLWSNGCEYGAGYPAARVGIQVGARKKLAQLSQDAHKPMCQVLDAMDGETIRRALSFPGVADFIGTAPDSPLKAQVLRLARG